MTYSSLRFSQTSYSLTIFLCSSSFIKAISRSSPNGIGLYPGVFDAEVPFVLSMRFAKLCARVLSAVDRAMILTAPTCVVYRCRTARTCEHPPLPIVFPSCQCPIYAFRLRPEAFVDVVEMAELRFEASSSTTLLSLWSSGDVGCERGANEPLASSETLCGS